MFNSTKSCTFDLNCSDLNLRKKKTKNLKILYSKFYIVVSHQPNKESLIKTKKKKEHKSTSRLEISKKKIDIKILQRLEENRDSEREREKDYHVEGPLFLVLVLRLQESFDLLH